MKRIFVLGAFGYDSDQLDGQTVKTRNVYKLLQSNCQNKPQWFDTMHIRKHPLSILRLFRDLIRCDVLILIPCLNNLTFIFPITYYLSKIVRFKIIHICIGGWQVEYFKGDERFSPHPLQLKLSKKIRAFLPEMTKVDTDLKSELGFTNSEMFPNFRFIDCNSIQSMTHSDTLRLVFLARVDKKKGYDTIFNFAKDIIERNYNITIDFYGQINIEDKEEFLSLVKQYSQCVSYKGVLSQDEVTGHLVNYDVMLLPTTVFTEGFPGTILDAYIAGIPVIATAWKHSYEFIDDNRTGFIVPFGNCQQEFNEAILKLYQDRNLLNGMKERAFEKRLNYSSEAAWSILSKYI